MRGLKYDLRVCLSGALRAFAASLLLLLMAAPGRAAVEISFYSHEFGANFPHAFVVLAGTDDRSGQRIDANYGFTATHVRLADRCRPVNTSAAHGST